MQRFGKGPEGTEVDGIKQISNKEYEKYQQYQTDKLHGRILAPDGLRVVRAGLDKAPEKTGIHMLEMPGSSGMKESWNKRNCSGQI